jgi:hypothetical protein
LSIFVQDASGQLITALQGAVTFTLTTDGLLVATKNADGSVVLVLNTDAILGAKASIDASGTMTITGTGAILPIDSTPPARTASSTLTVVGQATPEAKGHMNGSALPYTELSPQSLASAVWSSSAGENNTPGTMGEKLNGAGSAGNPWTEVIESGLTASEVLRIILAVQAGRTEITGNNVAFKAQDGITDRLVATVENKERVDIVLNP